MNNKEISVGVRQSKYNSKLSDEPCNLSRPVNKRRQKKTRTHDAATALA